MTKDRRKVHGRHQISRLESRGDGMSSREPLQAVTLLIQLIRRQKEMEVVGPSNMVGHGMVREMERESPHK